MQKCNIKNTPKWLQLMCCIPVVGIVGLIIVGIGKGAGFIQSEKKDDHSQCDHLKELMDDGKK